MNFYTKKLKQEIAANKTESVLLELVTLLIDVNDFKSNEAILLLARFNQLHQDFRLGILDYEFFTKNKNQINHSLLMFVNELSLDKEIIDKIIDKQKEEVEVVVNEKFFTVDLRLISNDPKDIYTYPLDAFSNYQYFLNQIYFIIDRFVEPFTYGEFWIFENIKDRSYIKHIRMLASSTSKEIILDQRSLEEVGIKPNMVLKAILLK